MPANHNCRRCPLHLVSKKVCVWGEGSTKPGGIMLIGEALGAEEEMTGRPFMGAAGKELNSCIVAAGHQRSDVYISNICKCRPPGNRTPVNSEVAACFPYLVEEIETVKPKVILCLGGAALKALTGKDGIAVNRGKQVPTKWNVRIGDAKVFATYHPAASLHNRNPQEIARIREAIVQDLKLAFSMTGENGNGASDHKRALLSKGYSTIDLERGLDALSSCKVLACDLEWTALKDRSMSWPWTHGAELYTISLSGRLNGSILSLAFSWPPPEGVFPRLQDFFSRKPVIFHNALADLNWLQHVGLAVRLAGDTLVLAHLMDEQQRLSLDQLAPLYTDVQPGWKIGPWDKRPSTEEEWLEVLRYNQDDSYATLKLAEALHQRLESLPDQEREGIKRVYYNLMLPVIPTMVSMAIIGIPMDEEGVARELTASNLRTKDISRKVAELIGCNPSQAATLAGSPTKTLDYLQKSYNLSIDTSRKDDLAGYEDTYPVIGLIQQYRWERNKVQGTYLGPWQELLKEQQDGRLHSVYRITYARTGRTSAEIEKGGSLQLMPRDQEDRILKTRKLVKARDGYQILAADQGQVEMRVMAWFANDKTMIQLFKEGADLHAATAAFIKSRIPLDKFWSQRTQYMQAVTKDERQGAKGVNFGLIFGLQPEGLMDYSKKTYGVDMSLQEAILAHDAYFKMYYGVKEYHDFCRRVIFPRGYTQTPFGRMRRGLDDPNKAINTPIQSTASDLSLLAMNKVDLIFKTNHWLAYVIGFVHDSILCEVREDYVERAKVVVKEQMECPDLRPLGVGSLPVPLKADIAVGQTWGEAK